MAKIRAEHADIETAAVTHANDSLWIDLVGNANARSECLQSVVRVAVAAGVANHSHADDVFLNSHESAFLITVYSLGEIDLPAQPVIESEFGSNAPSVLAIEEPALLTFGRVETGADEAVEAGNISE